MQVIQATAWYPPYDLGGTEVYVEGLVAALRAYEIKSRIIAPRHRNAPEQYGHQGAEVTTYPVGDASGQQEIKQGIAHEGFALFRAWLSRQEREIYHQHSWTRGCGLHHLRAARDLGFRTVLTIHVPGNLCLRGTMLRFGEEACDGLISDTICGACWAHGRGLARRPAKLISHLPLDLAQFASRVPGRISTALSARALGFAKGREFTEMVDLVDRVVVVCQWLADALILNGAPADKVVLSRQGVDPEFAKALKVSSKSGQIETLRLLYLGRWDPVKGIDVAVRAVQSLPRELDVRLSIHAINTLDVSTYEREVRALAANDPRISIEPPVAHKDLPDLFAKHDALLIPSRWLETGPLVVLEAQAAGLFILGSDLGGIAELVKDDETGFLLPSGNVKAWAAAIARVIQKHAAGQLQRATRQVRTMEKVANEMAELYRELMA